MTKPKPPRVLNYDPEFGHIVAGTHDVALAKSLLVEHVTGKPWLFCEPERYVDSLRAPDLVWGRCSQAHRDEQYRWMWQRTEPHARGAFPAVEWSR